MKLSVLLIVVKNNSTYSTWPVRSADKTQLRAWLYPKTWGNRAGLCKYVANCDMIISAKMIKAQRAVKQDVTFKWWWKQLLCSLKEEFGVIVMWYWGVNYMCRPLKKKIPILNLPVKLHFPLTVLFVSGIKPCLQDMSVIYFSEIWYYKFAKYKKESGVIIHQKNETETLKLFFLTSRLTWANCIPICFK